MDLVDVTTPTYRRESAREERHMASIFVILTPSGEITERTYAGCAAEQFAAYVAEFPIGSGASLRYTRSLAPIEPLAIFG